MSSPGTSSILLIPALFVFTVHADVSDRVLDLLSLLFVLLIVGIPLCVPILMKKRMEKRAAVLERDFPNINYKFTSHNCVLSIWIPRAATSAWCGRTTPSRLQMADPAQITDIRTNHRPAAAGHRPGELPVSAGRQKGEDGYTLRVSGGQLSMKHPRVMEAIAKADQLGEALRAVQAQRMRGGA